MADSQRTPLKRRIEKTCIGCGCAFTVCITHRTQRYHSRACANIHIQKPVTDRFWEKVAVGDAGSCWEWRFAQRNVAGYGMFRDPARRRSILAHRFSWELANGPIPDGLFVCHHCDNPSCVNPSHLFVGSAADNSRDMHLKGRGSNGPRRRGSDHHAAKLTEDHVLAIRAQPKVSVAKLANRYGVGQNTIYRIRSGETWGHIR